MSLSRAWRRFDLWLLAALVALTAYGVVMIYSATLDTLGVEDAVQRQLVFFGVGLVVLLIAASVPYSLIDVVQQPFPVLVPLVLALTIAGVLVGLRSQQLEAAGLTLQPALLAPDVPAMILGVVLVALVYAADRRWHADAGSGLLRVLCVAVLVAGAGAAVLVLRRLGAERLLELRPFLVAAAVAGFYLADCLALRLASLLTNPWYVLTLALLGITLLVGQVAGGAQSWLGGGTVQPSEPAKLLVIVILAKYLSDRGARLEQFGSVVTSLVLVALPMLLIYLQPDLGTALTLVPMWLAMVWTAGLRLRYLFVLAAGAVAALPLVWFGMQDYMRDRLMLFLDPASDPDAYFNVHQSLVSIGSGGWLGKGLTHGTQSQLHFLRVRHTDFIFAVTAEELGFAGAMVMIGLVLFLVLRMLRVVGLAPDLFGRLVVAGVTSLIFFQAVVSIGMNLGVLPVTGLPLPFVSYGGSSLVTFMAGAGLVESVAMRHKKLEFG